MNNLVNYLLSVLKKEEYILDSKIPLSYILKKGIGRLLMLFVGLFIRCKKDGFLFVAFNSKIRCQRKIKVGRGVTIDRNCYIDALSLNGIVIGNNVSIGKNTTLECTGSLKELGKGIKIGNNVGLGTHGFFGCAGGVSIGNDTIFGNFVSVHSENHNFCDNKIPIRLQGVNRKGIVIGNNCWIGSKVTILDGVIIEDGCIFAAGSVVIAGIYKGNCIYAGVPAKFLKKRY